MKILKQLEEAMLWAYETNRMELFQLIQNFFELTDEDYEADSESESDDDIENILKGEPEDLEFQKDEKGFYSLV